MLATAREHTSYSSSASARALHQGRVENIAKERLRTHGARGEPEGSARNTVTVI